MQSIQSFPVGFMRVLQMYPMEELAAHGFQLFYYNSKKTGEIDFLIEHERNVIAIEVKSGKDYKRHSALNNLLSNECFGIRRGYVLSNFNLKAEGNRIYLPIYMLMFLKNGYDFPSPTYLPKLEF